MNSSNVAVTGWLRKSPPEKKLHKNAWRKRWFVLRSGRLSGDPNLLEYYKHQGSKKPIGSISLDECSQIDANVPLRYERKDPSKQFVFDIVTKQRTYFLIAESTREMSFWVRHLCDLCGFNHDSADNQQDLGSQQQTFRANQSISRGTYQNGVTSLLDNEQEPPTDAPPPLPRPERTITHRSILIRNRGTEGHVTPQDPTGSTSAESNQLSMSGTPGSLRRNDTKQINGYSYATESNPEQTSSGKLDANEGSEYLLLSDFKTAQSSQKVQNPKNLLSAIPNMSERRSSTDSVFTHEDGPSDGNSDVLVEQPVNPIPSRFVGSSIRKQRLDSMPDCPPPPPPVKAHTERPLINMIDERGYTFPPGDESDDDVITEARKRSVLTSGGLSPIDDSDLNKVPIGLQREFGVDEMGRRIPGSSSSATSSRMGAYNTSSGYGTEYINTADASTEARFGNFSSGQRSECQQQFPIVGAPFVSPNNRSGMSQMTNNSVFFTSPGPSEMGHPRSQLYDTPSPVVNMYAFPRTASPHNYLSHKGSLYSSTNTLSPYGPKGSPMHMNSPRPSPVHVTRMRRSSSVGQLEGVTADLEGQVGPHRDSPSRVRRSSIDNRRPTYNTPSVPVLVQPSVYGSLVPMDHLSTNPNSAVPPPRPPKSDTSNKEVPASTESEYFNLYGCYTEGVPKPEEPPSPPHTEVISFSQDYVEEPSSPSPPHTTIVKTIPFEEATCGKKEVQGEEEKGSRTSSSSGGSSSGSSSGRSSSAAVYDVSAPVLREPSVNAPLYDTPKKLSESVQEGNDIYDCPKPASSIYDTPNNKTAQLADIDEGRADYEQMMDQLAPIQDDVPSYTCMGGAATLVTSPPFVKKAPLSPITGRSATVSEPPPVKRDLKPKIGRASLGSDGGGADSSKQLLGSNFEDSQFEHGARSMDPPISPPHAVLLHSVPSSMVAPSGVDAFTVMRPNERVQPHERMDPAQFEQGGAVDPPISPPHVSLMHTMASSNVVNCTHDSISAMRQQDRLQPPERPPKFSNKSSLSSLSPRTPPSIERISPHVPDRPPPYNFERTRYTHDGAHSLTKQKGGSQSYVPGRPPKPISMIPGASHSPVHRERSSFSTHHARDYGRSQMTYSNSGSSVFTPGYGGSFHMPMSAVVPPPPMDPLEKKLTYVELGEFDHRETSTADSLSSSDRVFKSDGAVEYSVLDHEKTEALQKMKVEREKEQLKRGSAESRSIKGGKT